MPFIQRRNHRKVRYRYYLFIVFLLGVVANWRFHHPGNDKCREKGIIVLNTLGRLANNVIELSYAKKLSEELCFTIVYRPSWSHELPSTRGTQCLPNAKTKEISLPGRFQKEFGITARQWEELTKEKSKNEPYLDFVSQLEKNNRALCIRIPHWDRFNHTQAAFDELVLFVRNSKISLISMEGFFVSFNWMRDSLSSIQHWMQVSPTCCKHHPGDAVVLHVRAFRNKSPESRIEMSVYRDLLEYYNLVKSPIWIVCPPHSVDAAPIQYLKRHYPHAQVIAGNDQYDAFCILQNAKTVITSAASTFSQMGALLGNAEVHVPIFTTVEPYTTLQVPGWHYHIVNFTSVVQYNVDSASIIVKEN